MIRPFPVFDGHNDILSRLVELRSPDPERAFVEGRRGGHLDLPRMKAGGFAGGLFAMFVPSGGGIKVDELMQGSSYDVPLP